jgi:hypothetical protein
MQTTAELASGFVARRAAVMFSAVGLIALGIACAFIGASIDSYRLEIRRLLLEIKTDVGELKDLNNRIVDFGGEQ